MRTAVLIGATIIISIVIAGVLSLNYVFTSNAHVEITSFNTTGTSSGSSIDFVNVWFSLNLTNTGEGDARDLVVTFSANTTHDNSQLVIYTNSTPPYDRIAEFQMGQPYQLGDLMAYETREYKFYWTISGSANAPTLTATLKANEAILDQAVVTIPPIPNVKITNFICTGVWHGTRLGAMLDLFSHSYSNLGTSDVGDLTLTLNTSKINNRDIPRPTPNPDYHPYRLLDETINGETYSLESLKAKETKAFDKTYFMDMGFLLVEPFTLTATLKSNNTILDQATITIPITDSNRGSISDEYIG